MSQITTSMAGYFGAHPELKYLFFGGKGGVGKTALAGATALWQAGQGKKTLLAYTNPVHSLSSLLDQSVFGAPAVFVERGGKTLATFAGADDRVWPDAVASLVKDGRLRRVELRRIDSVAATEHPSAERLREVGFVDGYRGLTLRG